MESQHSSCSPHTTTLSLVKENLVSAFDGISDLHIFNSTAVEAFSSGWKKGLTVPPFETAKGLELCCLLTPAVISLGKECIQEYRKCIFFMLISDISDNKENWVWMVFLVVDFE